MFYLKDSSLLRTRCFIDGQWCDADSGETITVTNPATGEIIGTVPKMGAAETRRAIEAANAAYPAWRARTAGERSTILRRWFELLLENQEDLATIMTAEQGKPLAEAKGEIVYAASFIEWFAEEGKRVYGDTIPQHQRDKRIVVLKEPIGVCAAITPWNFPAAMITRKAGPALAVGCPMVVKPASLTPFSALALAELASRAGVPAGVFSVVTGASGAIGGEMTANPIVRKLTFTGSTDIGKLLMKECAGTVKKLALELGGNAPFIVFDDADLDAAVEGAIVSKFRNTGQVCIAPSRFFVHESVRAGFTEAAVELTRRLKMGSGLDDGVQVGPMIEPRFVENAKRLIEDARRHGATVLTGGNRPARFEKGYFLEPTVVDKVDRSMALLTEEPFAPIMPILGFDQFEAMLAEANNTPYGLAAYVFTNDLTTATRMAEGLDAGIIGINDPVPTSVNAPFGGMKESGLGRELGQEGLEAYLETKFVSIGLRP